MNLEFSPIWSWTQVSLVIIALVVMVVTTYPRRVRHLPPLQRRLLLGLRLGTVLVLAIAMIRPAVPHEEKNEESLVLLVIADNSRSMQTLDGPGGISRREAILKTLADSAEEFEALKEKVEIRYYDFSEELTPVTELSPEAPGNLTRMGRMLERLMEETQEKKRYLGVVLLSDGAEQTLLTDELDAKSLAKIFNQKRRIPIYPIGFGGSSISESSRDLIVENLVVDPLVRVKKTVPVKADLRLLGAGSRDLTVRLLVEDRSGVAAGESGEMRVPPATQNSQPSRIIRTEKNQDVISVELSYVPQQLGSFKIGLEIVPIEGELREGNNRKETIVSVQKGTITVAYFDTFRPEQKFIRTLNRAEKIQLDFLPVRYGGIIQTKIDASYFEPKKYDVYIIGDVPARVFGAENLTQLAARINSGAGFLMTGGANSFGAGGYQNTPLARFLPVELPAVNDQYQQPLKMVPSRLGLFNYVMQLDVPSRNEERWKKLAPMAGANKLQPKNPAVKIFAEAEETKLPLLFSQEVGPSRVMAFAGDTTYQWFLGGEEDSHQRFWQQMILWLAHKEQEGDQAIWVTIDPRNFTTGAPVNIAYGARDADGLPVTDAEFQIEVRQPNGDIETVRRKGSQKSHLLEFTKTQLPGDYWVRVRADKDGGTLGADAWSRFVVDYRDLEMDNPAANLQFLEDLAKATGGVTRPAEDVGKFLTAQLGDIEDLTFKRLDPLWDDWRILLLFVSLMTAEWFLRKKRGLV